MDNEKNKILFDKENNKMITYDLLKKAYEAGVAKLVTDPDLGHGTVCQIGEYWFIFGGLTGESLSPEDYIRNVPEEDILRELMEVLDCFKTDPSLVEEYHYYEKVLNKWEKKKERNFLRNPVRNLISKLIKPKADDKTPENPLLHISTDAMIKELVRRDAKIDCCSVHSLLESSGYFAFKLWTDEDIKSMLENDGYALSDNNVSLVLNTGYLRSLSECTDSDWDMIRYAITCCSSELERATEEEAE